LFIIKHSPDIYEDDISKTLRISHLVKSDRNSVKCTHLIKFVWQQQVCTAKVVPVILKLSHRKENTSETSLRDYVLTMIFMLYFKTRKS